MIPYFISLINTQCTTNLRSNPLAMNLPLVVSPSHLNDQDEWAFVTFTHTTIYHTTEFEGMVLKEGEI